MPTPKIDLYAATAIVVANMIGTGVFTSLGFQVMGIHSEFALLLLWVIGGVIALCGALVYGEIGSALPESGGEYYYLSKLYHPAIGFLSGWVSVTVGFAAPIAAAGVALGMYVKRIFPSIDVSLLAIVIVLLLTWVHSIDLKFGGRFQKVFTILKIAIIAAFLGAGFFYAPVHSITLAPADTSMGEIFSGSFAVSLVFVSYAYSGWNAAAYLGGELSEPKKNLPKSLLIGTLLVTVIYTALNYIFLYAVPMKQLEGCTEVGYLAAEKIFGNRIGSFFGLTIAFLLISTISAMILAGPRVMSSMGKDMKILSFLDRRNARGVPFVSVIIQSVIAIILILTSSFSALITYVGFTLSLCTFLTVAGVFILRKRTTHLEKGYRTWGYPVTPLIFLAGTGWVMIFVIREKPMESLLGFLTILSGLPFYYLNRKLQGNNGKKS